MDTSSNGLLYDTNNSVKITKYNSPEKRWQIHLAKNCDNNNQDQDTHLCKSAIKWCWARPSYLYSTHLALYRMTWCLSYQLAVEFILQLRVVNTQSQDGLSQAHMIVKRSSINLGIHELKDQLKLKKKNKISIIIIKINKSKN